MSHFFAYLSRMKLIERWSLMQSFRKENVQEHSLQVAMIAHCLAVTSNKYYDGQVDPERIALLAVFHDASEVLTGDLPTPVKYFNSDIKTAYKEIEKHACERLLAMLPEEYQPDYNSLLAKTEEDEKNWKFVKAADTIAAYIKCEEETTAGNREFNAAKKAILAQLQESPMPEVGYFMKRFLPSFSLSLDELSIR